MLFISNRERKNIYISMIINTILFTFIVYYFWGSRLDDISSLLVIVVILFLIQFTNLILPSWIELLIKSPHPKEKTIELERKIAMIKEEIKRVNGEDYNEDIFYED